MFHGQNMKVRREQKGWGGMILLGHVFISGLHFNARNAKFGLKQNFPKPMSHTVSDPRHPSLSFFKVIYPSNHYVCCSTPILRIVSQSCVFFFPPLLHVNLSSLLPILKRATPGNLTLLPLQDSVFYLWLYAFLVHYGCRAEQQKL